MNAKTEILEEVHIVLGNKWQLRGYPTWGNEQLNEQMM